MSQIKQKTPDFNPFSLKDKTILISGASSGIGARAAIDCSQSGAKVILLGRNKKRLQEVEGQCNQQKKPFSYAFDLTIDQQINALIQVLQEVPVIDGFVHAAGISGTFPFRYASTKKMEDLFRINVFSGFELTRLMIKNKILSEKGASIVFISSVMAMVGENAKSVYSMTKGAVESATRSLAIEFADKKIRFNCISPALVESPMSKNTFKDLETAAYEKVKNMHPLGTGKPEDVSHACLYLLSDAAKWVTGSNLVVDGGYTAH